MPFDGKNFTETKPDVFSLEGLIAWLEKQPADETYCYYDVGDCLWGKYVKAMGGFYNPCTDAYHAGGKRMPVSFRSFDQWEMIAAYPGPESQSDTYGAALKRARALQAR